MEPIAQTNVQLYNQLQRQGRSDAELALVRRAYDLARSIYNGHFQADGVPFVAHVIGVASIVAQLKMSTELVAAACLHNVYTAADFGDGLRRCATDRRRKVLERAVGPEVEGLVHEFWTLLREKSHTDIRSPEQFDRLTARQRQLLILDLADMLEKCHELGPLYYGDSEWFVGYARLQGSELIELAERLGQPALATMLSDSIAALLSATVSSSLRPADSRQRYARFEMPNSCMLRPRVVVRRTIRRLLQLLQRRGSALHRRRPEIAGSNSP